MRDLRLPCAKRRFLLTFFLSAAVVLPAAPRIVGTVVGFNDVAVPGAWTSVWVSLENRGLPFRGEIVVTQNAGERFARVPSHETTQAVELADGSRKTVFLLQPLSLGPYPIEIALTDEQGTIVAAETSRARRVAAGESLFVVLSRRPVWDHLLAMGPRRHVVYSLPERLPLHWAGWDGVDLLVLHDVPLDLLQKTQIEAIEDWVSAGGNLLVVGGPGATYPPALQALLPVRTTGTTRLLLPSTSSQAAKTVVASRVRLAGGRVLAAVDGDPVIVSHDLGRGSVVFAAADISSVPVRTWEGIQVVEELVRSSGTGGRLIDTTQASAMGPALVSRLLQLPLFVFPPRWPAALYLVAYLGVLAQFLLFWRRVRLGIRIAATILLPLVAAAGVYGLFDRVLQSPGALHLSAAVSFSDGTEAAWLREEVLVVAARGTALRMKAPSPLVLAAEGADARVTVEGRVGPLTLRPWETRRYTVDSLVESALVARVEDERHLLIEAREAADRVLVFWGDRALDLGRLERGAELLVDSGRERWMPREAWRGPDGDPGDVWLAMVDAVLASLGNGEAGADSPLLVVRPGRPFPRAAIDLAFMSSVEVDLAVVMLEER
jgi:hypothetical protein